VLWIRKNMGDFSNLNKGWSNGKIEKSNMCVATMGR
jgi:hypothetical protein